MFTSGSRYEHQATYRVRYRGRSVAAVRPAQPLPRPPVGYHRHDQAERLDVLAAKYLSDPTAFWRICDTNNTVVPAALSAAALIAIPGNGE